MMDTNYYNKKVSDFFHIYSDGTRMDVLFETDEDCVFGMNLLAVSAFQCHLEIICPEIMKTHFHLIIKGEAQQVRKFAGEIKRRLTGYFHRDGRSHIVKDAIQIVSDPICSEEELRTKIIYVFRNCTEAGFRLLPEEYPWGPGHSFFHKRKKGKPISSLSYREQCRLFHTRTKLPAYWEFDDQGMLLPGSYIDLDFFHTRIFQSTRQFLAFLNVKKRDLAEMESADARIFLERKDEDALRKEIGRYSQQLHGVPVRNLSEAKRLSIATKMWTERKTFSVKQLARLTRLSPELLRTVLHIQP